MVDLPRSLALLVGSLALAGTAASQQLHHVWVVNAPSQLQPAVDAAAEGDTVLVKASGNYTLLVLAKSLTVIADPPADVYVTAAVVRDLATSQRVELRRLRFPAQQSCYPDFVPNLPGLTLVDNEGLVWVENCLIGYPYGSFLASGPGFYCHTAPGLLVDHCANVVLLRTRCEGAGVLEGANFGQEGPGLVVKGGSRIVAHGCTFRGANGYGASGAFSDFVVPGAIGLHSESSQNLVFLSDCVARGGEGAYLDGEVQPICSNGGAGITSAGVTRLFDSQTTGGSGGFGSGCHGNSGPAFTGNVQSTPGEALRFSVSAPVREGQSYQLDFLGPPGTPTWFLVSPEPTNGFRPRGPLLAAGPIVSFAGITDATGALQVTRSMPNMPPSLELGRLYAQAFYLGPRGEFVLGGGSLFLALDQSF